jgi:transcriptional regulator with XRE-family HTH domain
MVSTGSKTAEAEIRWTPSLIKRLRGKRSQSELGELLGVPKNTVWRWEAGRTAPDREHAKALSRLAARQGFLKDWKVVGSLELLDSLEDGSKKISAKAMKSLLRSVNELSA